MFFHLLFKPRCDYGGISQGHQVKLPMLFAIAGPILIISAGLIIIIIAASPPAVPPVAPVTQLAGYLSRSDFFSRALLQSDLPANSRCDNTQWVPGIVITPCSMTIV